MFSLWPVAGSPMRPRRSGLDVMAHTQPYPPAALHLPAPPSQQQHPPPHHMPHPQLLQHFSPSPTSSHPSQNPMTPQLPPPPLDDMMSSATHAPTTRSSTRSEQQPTTRKSSHGNNILAFKPTHFNNFLLCLEPGF